MGRPSSPMTGSTGMARSVGPPGWRRLRATPGSGPLPEHQDRRPATVERGAGGGHAAVLELRQESRVGIAAEPLRRRDGTAMGVQRGDHDRLAREGQPGADARAGDRRQRHHVGHDEDRVAHGQRPRGQRIVRADGGRGPRHEAGHGQPRRRGDVDDGSARDDAHAGPLPARPHARWRGSGRWPAGGRPVPREAHQIGRASDGKRARRRPGSGRDWPWRAPARRPCRRARPRRPRPRRAAAPRRPDRACRAG